MSNKFSVFIGSSSEGKAVARNLDLVLTDMSSGDLDVHCWDSLAGPFALNEGFLESLTRALTQHDFAVLVATADDAAQLRGDAVLQARDNVIFELGLFMGRLGRSRTFLLCSDDARLRLPSDLTGVTMLRFDPSEFAESPLKALKLAGQRILEAIKGSADDRGYFFVFPSLENDHFFLDLLAGVSSSATRDMTLLVPSAPRNGRQLLEHLDDLAARQRAFKGGLIVPTRSGLLADEFRSRIERFKIPIALVDVNPIDDKSLPERTYYVGVDNFAGGKMAAEYLRAELANIADPQILILASPDQPKRHEGFIEGIGKIRRHVEYADFSKSAGRERTLHALKHYATASDPFHGIFAAGDELAFGAVTALEDHRDKALCGDVVVVGFDGAPVATMLIDRHDSPLRNTVVQDARALGAQSMGLLRDVVEGRVGAKASRERILPVRLYLERRDGVAALPK